MRLYQINRHRGFYAGGIALALLNAGASLKAGERFWDGGAASLATPGDAAPSAFTGGTWNTTLTNWDEGDGLAHAAWNNANRDTAIFGGPYAATNGIRTVDLTADIVVDQLKIITGSTGNNRYDIGSTATEPNSITFAGTYSAAFPAFVASNAQNASGHNTNFNAKITGTLSGGLVIGYESNITAPGSSGRLNFTNAGNDFTGNVTLLGGNLSAGANLGAAANKLILQGGALFVSGGAAVTTTFARNIEVAGESGIGTNATSTGIQALQLTGIMTGSSNLTRYANVTGTATSDVRLQGDLSGYTGMIENRGGLLTVQTTAISGGSWKLTGGTLKLDTAEDAAIANGAGKSNLLMNGGTLDLNGKNETINGLEGDLGVVQNQPAGSAATLTLGDGNATATFGGMIRDNSGTGGSLAVTKIGTGTQTLTAMNTYTGLTSVTAGILIVDFSIASAATVSGTGVLGGIGTLAGAAVIESGKISPATSNTSGILSSVGDVLFAAGSQYVIQINSDGTPASDRLAVTGSLDLGGATLTATDLGTATLPLGTRLVIATASAPITRTFDGRPNNSRIAIGANTFTIKYNDIEGADHAVTLTSTSPSTGYASWALANGVGAVDADPDKDGVMNGVEYVLGTNPSVPGTANFGVAVVGPDVVFSFPRSDASETPDVAVVLQVSTGLLQWNANGSPYTVGATTATSSAGVTITENPAAPGADPGTDLITLKVPLGSDVRKSVRMKVTVTP